jgi:hypothetical protein
MPSRLGVHQWIFMRWLFFLCCAATVITSNAQTQEPKKVIPKLLLEGGFEFGGDELITVLFTNGSDQTLRAGQGGTFSMGGQLGFTKVDWLLLRASIGIKFTTTAAENANIRFIRWPLTLSAHYQAPKGFRAGLGITGHLGSKFYGDGFFDDMVFSSTPGPRLEIGYKWIAMTYTFQSYKTVQNVTLNANGFGFFVSFALPKR